MCVSAVVFIVGSGMYNKTAPQGNIMLKVCKCIGVSGSSKINPDLLKVFSFKMDLNGFNPSAFQLVRMHSSVPLCSLPSRTALGIALLNTQGEPTGWTGLMRNTM